MAPVNRNRSIDFWNSNDANAPVSTPPNSSNTQASSVPSSQATLVNLNRASQLSTPSTVVNNVSILCALITAIYRVPVYVLQSPSQFYNGSPKSLGKRKAVNVSL